VLAGNDPFVDAVAVGDFNGDGKPDIVTAGSNGLTVFLGQGDGTFQAEPSIYAGPNGAELVATGDFDGDGKLDVISEVDGTVSVQLGNGDGTFGAPHLINVGAAVDVAVGDFNGDGKLDFAVLQAASFGEDGKVQIFLGNGDGTFTPQPAFDAGGPIYNNGEFNGDQLVAADMNGDGKTDLVVSTTTGPLSGFLGDGHGNFTLSDQPAVTRSDDGGQIAVGDLNGDGIPDIVSTQYFPAPSDGTTASPATLSVLLGTGGGMFAPAISVPLPLPDNYQNSLNNGEGTGVTAVAVGDVNGDGVPDIVLQTASDGEIVLPGKGDGSFGTGYFVNVHEDQRPDLTLALADLNGDGRPDLVTVGNDASTNITDGGGVGGGPLVGIQVALNTPQNILPENASTIIDRAAIADPILQLANGPGTLTNVGNAYTLDLGMLSQNASVSSTFALANMAAAPADSFDGIFGAPTGSGFSISGASLPNAVAAGGSTTGLAFAADTGSLGSHSETLVFAPRDISTSGTSGLELAPITLTVTDAVVSGTALPPASLGPLPSAIVLPNIRVGATDTQDLAVTNAAASGAANLDVGISASGDASASGAVTGLAPQATDAPSLVVGVDSSTAWAARRHHHRLAALRPGRRHVGLARNRRPGVRRRLSHRFGRGARARHHRACRRSGRDRAEPHQYCARGRLFRKPRCCDQRGQRRPRQRLRRRHRNG
jgi:hypothetical protein